MDQENKPIIVENNSDEIDITGIVKKYGKSADL
jgi:hypothetical protein